MDTPTSVTVLTRDFMEDIGTSRILDAAKYVAGVGEATIPNGLDRVNIRGFQSDGRRVDGFSTSDQANYDSAGIDHMEIIKGPDALLQPAGVPGGTINLVSKRPQFRQAGYVTVQAGQYDSNRVEADVTGPIPNHSDLAYRLIGAYQDSDGYIDRSYRKSFFFSPSFSWRVSPASLLTVRYEYYRFNTNTVEGIPVDPSVGTNSAFRLLSGVPRDFNPALPGRDTQYRRVRANTVTLLFTSAITDRLSVRFAGRLSDINTPDRGFGWGFVNGNGGGRDPLTGLWTGGVVYSSTAPYAPSPAPTQSRSFTHTGTDQGQRLRYRDLQNDWVYTYDFARVSTQTSAGLAYAYEHQNLQARTQTAQPFNIDSFSLDNTPVTFAAYNTDRRRTMMRMQVYLTEKLELLNRRLILSGGVTHLEFSGLFGNKLANGGLMTAGDGGTETANYGVVVKPLSNLSVYYGHSESAVPQSNFEQVAAGTAPRFSVGKQDEFGAKIELLDKRLVGTVAYYEINQTGYSLANPANLTSPPPPVLLPPLILTRFARGWEYQVTGALTKELSVIASYADTRNRDPNGIPFRSAAEKMGALYVRYEFSKGPMKGFAAGLGVTYTGKRAGDVATGYTPASTPTSFIPNQPSFYLPAQTLVDLNLTYALNSKWVFRLNIANLLDRDNYYGSSGRNSVIVGNPRNIYGSVAYKF